MLVEKERKQEIFQNTANTKSLMQKDQKKRSKINIKQIINKIKFKHTHTHTSKGMIFKLLKTKQNKKENLDVSQRKKETFNK